MWDDAARDLIELAEALDTDPADVGRALTLLLGRDPARGASTALGILSREPRIKPSCTLVIDPGDSVRKRWNQRVEACIAVVSSPALCSIFQEIYDELSDFPELAADVLGGALVTDALPADRRAQLLALVTAPEPGPPSLA